MPGRKAWDRGAGLDAVASLAMALNIRSGPVLGHRVDQLWRLTNSSMRRQASSQASFHCSKPRSKKLWGAPS